MTGVSHDRAVDTPPQSSDDGSRALHVTWTDPLTTLQRVVGMNREELLAALPSGGIKPPIAELLGFDVLEAEPGRNVLGFRPAEYHCNLLGGIAAGVTATILDSALWIAVQSSVANNTIVSTVNLTLHFVRQVTTDAGDMRAEAQTVYVGRTTATAEARLVDAGGKLYAHATSGFHCATFDPGTEGAQSQ